jgi:phosphoribosylformylglycinamidine synthase
MTFTDNRTGLEIDISGLNDKDAVRILFSEKPGVVIQAAGAETVISFLNRHEIANYLIGKVTTDNRISIRHGDFTFSSGISVLRDTWYRTSAELDSKQTKAPFAGNYKKQVLDFVFPEKFSGLHHDLKIEKSRRRPSGLKAAIIREKGVNGDREMAWSMHLAGFDVKDVHMTDLISGRETLDDVQFIAFVGGFSNSDVLGSAKGWAGAFLFNEKAKTALDNFYRRSDTISLGVCNGCQLMIELGLICPEKEIKPKMNINSSGKFESIFLAVDILPNHSVMLSGLAGSRLGIWVAHGEGRFELALPEKEYHIPARFHYSEFPGNPNGSDYSAACLASADGRHLAIMPHLERSIYPWNWACYPEDRPGDEVSPWIEAFINARKWVEDRVSGSNQLPE